MVTDSSGGAERHAVLPHPADLDHQRSRRRGAALAVVATVAALTLASCGDDASTPASNDDAPEPGSPVIVATTSIWADVVSNVACDEMAVVETVIPTGVDSHAFEPSLADRGQLEDSALVVANGLGLEEGLNDTLEAVAGSGTPVFHVGDLVDPIPYSTATDSEGDVDGEDNHDREGAGSEDDHDPEDADPHVWFDPVRVSAVLPALADQLVTHAGLDAASVDSCLTAYQAELAAVDAEIQAILATVPEANRRLVTNHETLGYFADRYGFEVLATVIPAPSGLAETNPAQLEELAELIDDTGVPAIFAETQRSDDDARTLADRLGDVEVHTLLTDSLGEPGGGADTYVGLLLTDARLIADGLGVG